MKMERENYLTNRLTNRLTSRIGFYLALGLFLITGRGKIVFTEEHLRKSDRILQEWEERLGQRLEQKEQRNIENERQMGVYRI